MKVKGEMESKFEVHGYVRQQEKEGAQERLVLETPVVQLLNFVRRPKCFKCHSLKEKKQFI